MRPKSTVQKLTLNLFWTNVVPGHSAWFKITQRKTALSVACANDTDRSHDCALHDVTQPCKRRSRSISFCRFSSGNNSSHHERRWGDDGVRGTLGETWDASPPNQALIPVMTSLTQTPTRSWSTFNCSFFYWASFYFNQGNYCSSKCCCLVFFFA